MELQKTVSDKEKRPDLLRAYADLLQSISTLADFLRTEPAIKRRTHEFTFPILEPHLIVIPEQITNVLPDIDEISVTITQENDVESSIDQETLLPSMLSVYFYTTNETIVLSRDGSLSEDEDTTPDSLIQIFKRNSTEEPKIEVIEKITSAEINILLMSLMFPREDKIYMDIEQADFLHAGTYESIREALSLGGLNHVETKEHDFTSSDAHYFHTIRNGELESFHFSYVDPLNYQETTLESSLNTGFKLEASTRDNEGNKMIFLPGAAEITRAQHVIDIETMSS